MSLVAHNDLPTYERLRAEGYEVLAPDRAVHQDIRELHIGLLNMMPDAALQATERQFLRLVSACNRIVQFHVHPFTVRGVEREGEARDYVTAYYEDFETVARDGLDALIVTGANPREADITRETFWEGMVEAMEWARTEVCSTVMSCLASHAAFKVWHGIDRTPLPVKRWGVYPHRVVDRAHPLVSNINTRFPAPHSRWNDVAPAALRAAGLRVLIESEEAGFLAATSPDGLRFVYFQGHPEYDAISLPKEYKREVNRYVAGERPDYPPYPEHCFNPQAEARLDIHGAAVRAAVREGREPPPYPDDEIDPDADNTWTDTGKALFNNWLGLVYRLTDVDRRRPFMAGVDPEDPLGLRRREEDQPITE